jgi:hypothetical protein
LPYGLGKTRSVGQHRFGKAFLVPFCAQKGTRVWGETPSSYFCRTKRLKLGP